MCSFLAAACTCLPPFMASIADPANGQDESCPHYYVLINNVAKKTNVGNMMRSACAFNAKGMLVVGRKKSVSFFGSKGTKSFVPLLYFDSMDEACGYARNDGCSICGVEILDQSKNVVSHPFSGPTCFIMGNEGVGLMESEKAFCDFFVYIPHFGNGTASLNVTVAASIVFHHFATYAKYSERKRSGQKFVVADKPVLDQNNTAYAQKVKMERLRAKEAAAGDAVDMSTGGMNMFAED